MHGAWHPPWHPVDAERIGLVRVAEEGTEMAGTDVVM